MSEPAPESPGARQLVVADAQWPHLMDLLIKYEWVVGQIPHELVGLIGENLPTFVLHSPQRRERG